MIPTILHTIQEILLFSGPRSVNNFVAIEFEIPKSLREAKSYVSSKTDFFLKENTLDLMSRGLHRSRKQIIRSRFDHSVIGYRTTRLDQQSDQNIDSRLQLKEALFKDVVSLYGPKDVGLDMPSCLSTSPHVLGSNHAILTLFSQAQTQNGEQKGLNYLNEHDYLRQLSRLTKSNVKIPLSEKRMSSAFARTM